MSQQQFQFITNASTANGATYTWDYPLGLSKNAFLAAGATLQVAQTITAVAVVLGDTSAVITNSTGATIPAGTQVILSLTQDSDGTNNQERVTTARLSTNNSGNTVLVGPDGGRHSFAFKYDARNYGLVNDGRVVLDLVTAGRSGAGTVQIESNTAAFTQSDVGSRVLITPNTATAGYTINSGSVVSVQSATQATINVGATLGAIASGGALFIGRDQSAAMTAVLSAAAVTGGRVYIPSWLVGVNGNLVLPEGVFLEGESRMGRVSPFQPPDKGSALICTSFFADEFIHMMRGSAIANINIDAMNMSNRAVFMDFNAGTGKQNLITNAGIFKGLTTTLQMSGSSLVDGRCEIAGAMRGTPIEVVGDSAVIGCLIYGAGNTLPNMILNSITDDAQIVGNHFYKGGWGVDLTTITGPNLSITQWQTVDTAGGTITGNTFDTAQGNHIDVTVFNTGASRYMSALTITGNQFYQPQVAFADNTYSCINLRVGSTGTNNVSLRGVSISGNTAKGYSVGATTKSYKSFINFDVLPTYGAIYGLSVSGNTADNCNLLYSGTYTLATLPAGVVSGLNAVIPGNGTTVISG